MADQAIYSSNNAYRLLYQSDGNLVVYRNADNVPMWHTNTWGTSPGQAVMQGDGNFVVYTSGGNYVFHTHTYGNPGAFLELGNDGKLRVYSAGGLVLWQS